MEKEGEKRFERSTMWMDRIFYEWSKGREKSYRAKSSRTVNEFNYFPPDGCNRIYDEPLRLVAADDDDGCCCAVDDDAAVPLMDRFLYA